MPHLEPISFVEGVHRGQDDLDGITVTEIANASAEPSQDGVLGRVFGVYERHGYDAGYRRGASDVLLSLLAETETFIRRRGLRGESAEDLRRVVWALQEHLRSLGGAGRHTEFEDGLGI